jgi:hypothetical protein
LALLVLRRLLRIDRLQVLSRVAVVHDASTLLTRRDWIRGIHWHGKARQRILVVLQVAVRDGVEFRIVDVLIQWVWVIDHSWGWFLLLGILEVGVKLRGARSVVLYLLQFVVLQEHQ